MGRALYDGWVGSGWSQEQIAVIDRKPSRSIGLVGDDRSARTMMVLAVKPQHVPAALSNHAHLLRSGDCVVSIAAGLNIGTLRSLLPAEVDVLRAMPNMPVSVAKGTICLCHPVTVQGDSVDAAREVLSRLGFCIVLEEAHMDAFTAMAGSGPAYFYALVENLARAGRAVGLPADISKALATQVFVGAADLLDRSGMTPAVLMDRIASPAGTTTAGLDVLNRDDALGGLVIACVAAAKKRSHELSGTPHDLRRC